MVLPPRAMVPTQTAGTAAATSTSRCAAADSATSQAAGWALPPTRASEPLPGSLNDPNHYA